MTLKRFVINLIMSCMMISGAVAGSLNKPADKPILVISGAIENTNDGDKAVFDRKMLEDIGMQSVATTNPWYAGKTVFEGVSLDKLLQTVGADGSSVTVVALNDYVTTIPIDDFKKFNVILAMKRDGADMRVRDKGPLFIIYPYDSNPELQTQTYYTRSAWQVAKIIVE